VDSEQVQTKSRGEDVSSLPEPWGKVSKFVKRYITCKGRYQVIYFSYFILLSHLRHQKLINIPYYLIHSLHNMDHFVRKSKHPMNCLSIHKLIWLLIHRGMGIPNDPLPEVEEQPISLHAIIANPEQPNPMPSTAPTFKALTVTACKSTLNTKCKIRNTSHTTQKCLDSVDLEQPDLIHTDVIDPHKPPPSSATITNTIPKPKKRVTLASVSTLPRKRTRLERFSATVIQAPTIISSTLTSSLVEPTSTQSTPIAATTVPAPTITTSELSQKITCQTRSKSQRSIERTTSEATQNPPIDAITIPSPTITTPEYLKKENVKLEGNLKKASTELFQQSVLILMILRPCHILKSMIQT
jgi:uncharacterized membrane protein YcgQ (UPF0703/DUF1980 family)